MRPTRLCDVDIRYPATSPPPIRRLCTGQHLSSHLTGPANDVQRDGRAFQRLVALCDQSGFPRVEVAAEAPANRQDDPHASQHMHKGPTCKHAAAASHRRNLTVRTSVQAVMFAGSICGLRQTHILCSLDFLRLAIRSASADLNCKADLLLRHQKGHRSCPQSTSHDHK